MIPIESAGKGVRNDPSSLAPREQEVIEAYLRYGSQQAVSEALDITIQTVKNHITTILMKLDVDSSMQAAVIYDRWHRVQGGTAERRGGFERRSGKDRRG